MAKKSRKRLHKQCHSLLKQLEAELIEDIEEAKALLNPEISGDSGDMSIAIEQRHSANVKKNKAEKQIREVRSALSRLENGTYGICEETGEDIEEKRLLSIPWTRYSIEGAEISERTQRQFSSAINRDADDDISHFED